MAFLERNQGCRRTASFGDDHTLASSRPANPLTGVHVKVSDSDPFHVHQCVTSLWLRQSALEFCNQKELTFIGRTMSASVQANVLALAIENVRAGRIRLAPIVTHNLVVETMVKLPADFAERVDVVRPHSEGPQCTRSPMR